MQPLPQPDFGSPKFKSNPFPYFARLRAEAPVFRIAGPMGEAAWLVTRYDDVMTVLKHPGFSKDRFRFMDPRVRERFSFMFKLFKPMAQMMLMKDPPDHTRLRGLVHKAFTPKLVERLRGRVQTLSDGLLDRVQRKGSLDLVKDYALPIPSTIIADMLGVPERDHGRFQRWSNQLVSNTNARGMFVIIPAMLMFERYLRKLIAQRRAALGEDLLSALIQVEEAGEKLTQEELISMVFLLLIAGHETTVNLISTGSLALLEHPDQLERLRRSPELIEPAIEELLRYTNPVELATERFAVDDVDLNGTVIPKGNAVFGVIGSANRDEKYFQNPDALDLGRTPNKHLSFGFGIHYCLGAPLARLEGQIAIQTLVNRLPKLRLAKPVESLRWRTGFLIRGPKQLPATF